MRRSLRERMAEIHADEVRAGCHHGMPPEEPADPFPFDDGDIENGPRCPACGKHECICAGEEL